MAYYLFEDDQLSGAHVYSAVTGGGEAVFSRDVNSKLNVQECSARIARTGRLCDRLFSVGKELVLSKKASSLLIQCKISPFVERLPVAILDSNCQIDEYLLWYSIKRYDVVDRAKAKVRMVGKCLLSVQKWVLDESLIPDYDLFFVAPNSWIVSEKIVMAFDENQISGVKLTKL